MQISDEDPGMPTRSVAAPVTADEAPASRPRVLVLLATYEGATHIDEQIRSLAAQRDVELRVIARDDGSCDGTQDVAVRAAADCGLSLAFLPSSAPSGSAARNFFHLLTQTRLEDADYIALCDQDDVWLPGKLARAVAELERTGAGGYSSNTTAWWPESGRRLDITKDFPQKTWDHVFESAGQGCTFVVRVDVARQFAQHLRSSPPGLDAVQFHDWLMYAWARAHGIEWMLDGERHILYRQTGMNVIGANAGWRAARVRVTKMRGGWLRAQAMLTLNAAGISDFPYARQLARFGLLDRLVLAVHAGQFRRRRREALVFLVACLTIGI
jgi:rhamnosyltransferase